MLDSLSKISKYVNVFLGRFRRLQWTDDLSNLTSCDVLFFCHDVDRGVSLKNQAYSPLIDSVREELEARGLRCQSIALPFSVLTGAKGYGSPKAITWSYVWSKVILRITPDFLVCKIESRIGVYGRILRKTGARLIISIGAPGKLCLAASNQDVFCVELLHGVSHTELPADWAQSKPGYLPQGVLSLSDTSNRIFSSLGLSIKTIPHPFIRRFRDLGSEKLPQEWLLPRASQSLFKKEILVSLMWGYSGDHGPYQEMAGILNNGLFFDELSEAIAQTQDIFWRFRFHPVQLREKRYDHLRQYMDEFVSANSNAEWKDASSFPFPAVSRNCSANVTMGSGSCYDAAFMGLSTLVLCPTFQTGGVNGNYFTDLENEGYVKKDRPNIDGIVRWANNIEKMPERMSNLNDDRLWDEAVQWLLTSSELQ